VKASSGYPLNGRELTTACPCRVTCRRWRIVMEPGSCAVLSAWAHDLRGCFSSPRAPLTLAGAYLCEPSPQYTASFFYPRALERQTNCPADGETAQTLTYALKRAVRLCQPNNTF
jgi:hypothetical protein